MIDIKQIRENPEKFKAASKAKKIPADIDRLLQIDSTLSEAKRKLQDIVTEKNRIGKIIPKASPDEKQKALSQLSVLKQQETELNETVKKLQPEFDEIMLYVPQPADEDVPFGEDDTQNVELRKEGSVRQFDFEPKDHVQLGLALDIIDIERGVKLAGTRNYFLKGNGALLHWAILRFSMDLMVSKGYVPMSVPLLMNNDAMRGTGYYPGSEEQTYRMEIDQLSLAGTAEVPLTAYHMGEILNADELPKKYVGLSTCFRREAGAAGKDTYGLYRIHQFDKVEQVVICTGDLGRGQAKKYDIETWMPSRKNFGETHSASKFYDFQARRLNLRYKDPKTKKNILCHTLNNTVIASPRILIPILELYQNADGSVTIPKVLRPYMNGKELIVRPA
jgi:seryl-tRNA synthetase